MPIHFSERVRALFDHMYLGVEVLGMDFQEVPHRKLFQQLIQKDPWERTPIYDLSKTCKKRMILWPRGTFKTSAIIVEMVQLILAYPNIRICFLTGGDQLAKRQLQRVKNVFEKPSALFKELFPAFCVQKNQRRQLGNMHEFTVPNRSNLSLAEPTMAITTAKSVKAGSHYDVIFVDDLVNETNYSSPEQLEKSKQNYKDICPLLAPDGYMYVTGTRYSFGDLYEEIREQADREMKETGKAVWEYSILPCWVRYCLTCEEKCHKRDIDHLWHLNATEPPCGECKCKGWKDSGVKDVLFPSFRCKDGRTEGHTIEKLERIRKYDLGDELFACQYLNEPIAAGAQTFTPELLAQQSFFQLKDMPTALQAPTFFVGDLGYVGSQDRRDMSVILVCRYWKGQIFVFDCIAGKWDSMALCENLFVGVMKYRPTMIWIEGFPGYEAYNTVMEIFCRDKQIQRFPVEWLKLTYHKDAKKIRMGSVKVPLKEKRLWLFAGMPYYERLCEDLKRWPKLGKHDDFGDCLGLVITVPSGYQLEQLPIAGETQKSWLRKLHAAPDDGSGYDARIAGSF